MSRGKQFYRFVRRIPNEKPNANQDLYFIGCVLSLILDCMSMNLVYFFDNLDPDGM